MEYYSAKIYLFNKLSKDINLYDPIKFIFCLYRSQARFFKYF